MYNKIFEDYGFEFRMTPSTSCILEGTKNKLYLLFEILVKEQKEKTKLKNPFNLALVLDRSGSMQGVKLDFAKKAVSEVVSNLRPLDTLHLVIYDTQVEVIFEKGDLRRKNLLLQKIKQILSGNSTFLSGGLLQGAELVQKHLSKDKSNRVFIFSDGLANVGLKSLEELTNVAKQINKKGINITSFGIGEDFDEDIMQNLALHGKGDYFFIDNADKIPNIVEEAIEGLLGLVLSNVELKLRSEKGVDIKKVYAYEDSIILGDVRETETRQVLVEVEVDPEVAEPNKLLSFDLQYRIIADIMNDKSYSETLGIPFTTNEEDIMNENADVLLTKHLLETAEKELEISKLIENLELDKAITSQQQLIHSLKNLSLNDKDGLLAEKIAFLENVLSRIQSGDYLMSRKMSRYSSYSSYYSKKRKMMDIMDSKGKK